MKQTTRVRVTAVAIVGALTALMLHAAERVRFSSAAGSYVKVSGTSTVHDWTVESKAIDGWIDFDAQSLAGNQLGTPLPAMNVTIKTVTLKSGKGGMDSVMYKALKAEQNPTITYQLQRATLQPSSDVAKGRFVFETKGRLTVAGAQHDVTMPVTVQLSGEVLDIAGAVDLKMTNFRIKPPTAMLGAVKSGDDIKVAFRWIVKQG